MSCIFDFRSLPFCSSVCNLSAHFPPGLLAVTLAILIKIVISKAVTISMTLCWIFISILIASLLVIVFVLGVQPKRNAIFSLNLSHPLLPASVLFGCIFLFTAIDVAAWIRLVIWTTIGNLTIIFNDFMVFVRTFSAELKIAQMESFKYIRRIYV